MIGRHNGVVTRMQAVAPDATWVHCNIHREALAAKGMPASLKDVLDTKLCETLSYFLHYALRWAAIMRCYYFTQSWLSRGKVMTRFFVLKGELKIFFHGHNFHLSEHLHNEEFLTCLGYLDDIFSRLNKFNLRLQGVSATIFNMRYKVEAMIKSNLWLNCMESNKTEIFTSLNDFLCANELCLTDSVKRDITVHLSELAAQLHR